MEISGISHRFFTLGDLSDHYPTITSCQLRHFRNEYLDEAEALPVCIWDFYMARSRELMGGLLSPRPDHEKVGTQTVS